MKNKRLLIVVIIALLLIFLIFKLFIGGKKYSFNIENASNISKIVIEKNNGSSKVELINNDIVKYTIDSINGEKRTTKKSSKEDIPEVDEYYTISFEGTEQKIYVYTKDEKHYIEEPHKGIYELSSEEYNEIVRYISF